jgi:hypothetical protein
MTEKTTGLGDFGYDIMLLIRAGGPMATEALRERLPGKLKDPAVRTVFRRPHDRGFVITSVATTARSGPRIIDWLCNGSVEEMAMGIVDTDLPDSAHRQGLAGRQAKAKHGRT